MSSWSNEMPPSISNVPEFDEQLRKLRSDVQSFNPIIGGWPVNIKSNTEAQQIRKRWEEVRASANDLLQRQPDSVEIKLLLGELLRMGHNIDVPDAAQASERVLKEVINAKPNDFRAYYFLASLYVSLNPQFAPIAESHFLKAEQVASPRAIPDIYQGLGFACIYQNKVPEAIRYFEKYLQMNGNVPNIQQIVAHLKSGKKFQIVDK